MGVTLRLRNLDDGQLLLGEFEDVEQARAWLTERPRFMEVVGVATAIDEATTELLRGAMRALDPEEAARAKVLDEARLQHLRDEIGRQQAAFEAETEAARAAAAADGDPSRPMTIAYDRVHGLSHADPADPREIPPVVREAVAAWVAERNAWVHARRVHVARATITVWPERVPGGDESERCQPGGQFEVEPGLD